MTLASVNDGSVTIESAYTGAAREVEAASAVMVTSREPVDDLFHSLKDRSSIQRIGDCLAPGTIATAVYSGHRYAREADVETPTGVPFRRE
jgi:dimethylamine/trimethylamine dehydrogenase